MTAIATQVGYRIRKIREAKDFNQQDIADKLKITSGAYAKIERGETDPSISRLFEIAAVLKTDIMALVKDAPEAADIYTQLKTLTKDVEQLKKEMAGVKKPAAKKK
jgi:transcriptional regulator with XRE-family HTH domain